MGEIDKTPFGWGMRFRKAAYAKGWTLAKLAEKLPGEKPGQPMAESTLRSWTNGNRDVNLKDFVTLCNAAGLDPAVVLFGGNVDQEFLLIGEAWIRANRMQKQVMLLTAKGILAEGEATGERESTS